MNAHRHAVAKGLRAFMAQVNLVLYAGKPWTLLTASETNLCRDM